jgi:hypothetical protein
MLEQMQQIQNGPFGIDSPLDVFKIVLGSLHESERGGRADFRRDPGNYKDWIILDAYKDEQKTVVEFRCVQKYAYVPSGRLGIQFPAEFSFDHYDPHRLSETWVCPLALDANLIENLHPVLDQIYRLAFSAGENYTAIGCIYPYFPANLTPSAYRSTLPDQAREYSTIQLLDLINQNPNNKYYELLLAEKNGNWKEKETSLRRLQDDPDRRVSTEAKKAYDRLCDHLPSNRFEQPYTILGFPGGGKVMRILDPGEDFLEDVFEVYNVNEPGQPSRQGFASFFGSREIVAIYDRIIKLTYNQFLAMKGNTTTLLSGIGCFLYADGDLPLTWPFSPGEVLEAVEKYLPRAYRYLSTMLYTLPDQPGVISHYHLYKYCFEDFIIPNYVARVSIDDNFKTAPVDIQPYGVNMQPVSAEAKQSLHI